MLNRGFQIQAIFYEFVDRTHGLSSQSDILKHIVELQAPTYLPGQMFNKIKEVSKHFWQHLLPGTSL